MAERLFEKELNSFETVLKIWQTKTCGKENVTGYSNFP